MGKVAVVGGGPAGMLAAAFASQKGHETHLFERNEKLGKKLFLTGKGRCNVTNMHDKNDFMMQVVRQPKFLLSAFSRFFNQDIVALLENYGVPIQVERGHRAFPQSDKSSDVIRALGRFMEDQGVRLHLNSHVMAVESRVEGGFRLGLPSGAFLCDAVILATGGLSYPSTGSTGDGYRFAKALGHTVFPPKASLSALWVEENWPCELVGLSLKNVTLRAFKNQKKVYDSLGEMLFTHEGVSGPLVLSASSLVADDPVGVRLEVDVKPSLDAATLDARIVKDFSQYAHKQIKNALVTLLPQRLIEVVLRLSGIPADKTVDQVTRAERQHLGAKLKCLTMTVKAAAPLAQAVITRGGVDVNEVDAKTMASKRVKGLYFAGELLDVDAQTGGYNLQIAYSTGVAAGMGVATLNAH